MGQHIFSQGVLDGACYLYSIMNAYKALKYPEMEATEFIFSKPTQNYGKTKWAYLIRTCPQVTDIFAGDGPLPYLLTIKTSRPEETIHRQFIHIIEMAFYILSDEVYQFNSELISLDTINRTDFTKSVVILAIDKRISTHVGNAIGNHFICIVGKEQDTYHIMCSWTLCAVDPEKYKEYMDNSTGRYYNNTISIKDINDKNLGKAVNGIYRISRV